MTVARKSVAAGRRKKAETPIVVEQAHEVLTCLFAKCVAGKRCLGHAGYMGSVGVRR